MQPLGTMNSPSPSLEDRLGAGLLAVLLLITLVNVVVRYFTDQSFAWTEEISCVLMLVLSLAGSAAALVRDSHIRVDNFFAGGTPARQRRLALFSALAVAAFFALFGVLSAQMAWDEFRFDETSPGIGIPKWIYSIWLPILCIAIAGRALGLLARKIGKR